MASQLTLFDPPPPVRPKYRLFLGTFPDAEAVTSISALQVDLRDRFALRGKFRPPHIFHVTLHHIGDYPEEPQRVIRMATEACSAAMTNQSPFEVSFDHVMSFGSVPAIFRWCWSNPTGTPN